MSRIYVWISWLASGPSAFGPIGELMNFSGPIDAGSQREKTIYIKKNCIVRRVKLR